MANFINPNDVTHTIIEETVFGEVPITGNRLELPVNSSQAPPVYKSDEITSDTKRPMRESNGSQRGLASSEWSVDMRLQQGPVFNLLIASACSGKWVGKKLKAGDTDTTFTIETRLKANAAVDPDPADGLYYRDSGVMANSLAISTKAKEGATISVGMIGLKREEAFEPTDLPVIGQQADRYEFNFKDLKAVSVGGQNLEVSSLDFETSQERDIRAVCGVEEGVDIGTTGARATKLNIKAFRKSFDINSAITGVPQSVSFTFGTVGNGYKFTIPSAIGQIPSDEVDGSSVIVNIDFTVKFNDVEHAGLIIEEL